MLCGNTCKTLYKYCFQRIVYKLLKNHETKKVLWASLIAQLAKNVPAMQETRVPFLGLEDALEKGMATHSSILAWEIPYGVANSRTRLSD